jgi:hypothetical protein
MIYLLNCVIFSWLGVQTKSVSSAQLKDVEITSYIKIAFIIFGAINFIMFLINTLN